VKGFKRVVIGGCRVRGEARRTVQGMELIFVIGGFVIYVVQVEGSVGETPPKSR